MSPPPHHPDINVWKLRMVIPQERSQQVPKAPHAVMKLSSLSDLPRQPLPLDHLNLLRSSKTSNDPPATSTPVPAVTSTTTTQQPAQPRPELLLHHLKLRGKLRSLLQPEKQFVVSALPSLSKAYLKRARRILSLNVAFPQPRGRPRRLSTGQPQNLSPVRHLLIVGILDGIAL